MVLFKRRFWLLLLIFGDFIFFVLRAENLPLYGVVFT
jgi:hypothetical protein